MDKIALLKAVFGHASFREGQQALIDALLGGRDALGIMPTGAGKSVCYQLPALLLPGLTLVVSPLISLMADQVAALRGNGVPAAYLNSTLTANQQAEALRRLAAGAYRIVYVAPERLSDAQFLETMRRSSIALIAVDEAHCVSQWGQDFRPSYRRIPEFVAQLPVRPPIGAFTATATPRVAQDIEALLLLRAPLKVTTSFDRPNLTLSVSHPADKDEALFALLKTQEEACGIVYCGTRKAVEQVCERLRRAGIDAVRYHAGLSDDERRDSQADFQYDRARVMVATNAFGMGIDKSNVRFVVHYHMPKDLESYYQEAGRAGRDGEPAECLLLYQPKDATLARYLITHKPVDPAWTAAERAQLLQRDLDRLNAMIRYAQGDACLRRQILAYFGETSPSDCGRCSVCHGDALKPVRQAAVDLSCLARLKEIRNRLAARQHLPAYLVFPDATLRDMAQKKPRTPEAFLAVAGVGQAKCRRYADAFLPVFQKNGAPSTVRAAKPSDKNQPKHAYALWSKQEEARLIGEFRAQLSIAEIASRHGRTEGSIRKRLLRLGLISA